MSKRKTSNILTLVAKYRLIDAQMHYDGTLTDDDDEFDKMVDKQLEEQRQILKRLARQAATDRQEVKQLLQLTVDYMQHTIAEEWHVDILQQVATALGSMDFEKASAE
jgi:hypothetical protein